MYNLYMFSKISLNTRLVILLLISAIGTWFNIAEIQYIYEKRSVFFDEKKQLAIEKQENVLLKRELQIRQTEEYKIKQAIEKLNYGKPGQELILIPSD